MDKPRKPLDYRTLATIVVLAGWFVLLGLLVVTPAYPQSIDHTDIVAAAKAQVVNELHIDPDAPGPDPSQPECPRWEVTRRAALMLVGERAGLLSKPSGNNCQGYAVDIIAYPDGTIVDVLGAGREGPSTPLWMLNPNKVDPARWREPVPLDPAPLPPAAPPAELPPQPAPSEPAPSPVPAVPAPDAPAPEPPSSTDLASVDTKLDQLLYAVEQLRQQQKADTDKIQEQINQVVKDAEKSVKGLEESTTPLILKILSLGIAK